MRQTILALATIGLATAEHSEVNMVEFMQYLGMHDKSYKSTEEFNLRLAAWHARDQYIKTHQAKEDRTFELGHNKFSDMLDHEVKGKNGYKPMKRNPANLMKKSSLSVILPPVAVDWRNENAVTGVKD